MRYVTIPKTNLNAACICFGTVNIGSAIDWETSFQMMDAYLAAGGNFIDTAKVYANWLPGERSISEKTIGRWLKTRGIRQEVILATKGAHPELGTIHISRLSRQEITSDLNSSLRNLQTDLIDLYWLHRDDPNHPVEDILAILNEQVKVGKIRYFGCSNWRRARIQAAQEYAQTHGLQGFSAVQNQWSLAKVNTEAMRDQTIVVMDEEIFNYHQQTGLAAIPFSSQANGYFNKKMEGKLDQMDSAVRRMYELPENELRYQRMLKFSKQSGFSITQIQLGYLLSQPFPVIPIIGPRTIGQLEDSLSAADVQLDHDQIKYLDKYET